MKKLLIAAAVIMAAGASTTSAQDRPKAGDISTEIQFNPFDQNGNTFAIDGLKVRYFLNEKHAFRLNLGLNSTRDKYSDEWVNGTGPSSYTTTEDFKSKNTLFKLNLGYERHFAAGKRADLYVGGELGFSKRFAKTSFEQVEDGDKTEITISNAALTKDEFDNMPTTTPQVGTDRRGGFGFRIAAIAGMDFYVYRGIYIGTELNFAINTVKTKGEEVETVAAGTTTTEESNASYKTTTFGFNIEPHIRLGWTF